MFSKIVTLEFGKQKKSFLGWLLIFVLTMIVVNLEALVRHRNIAETLSAVLAITAVGGIPLLAMLFGVSAATGLREQSARAAEEMLPFSPFRRVFGAYLTSLLYLLASSLILILPGIQFGSDAHFMELSERLRSMAPAYPAIVIHLHVLSFVLTYWLNQSVFAAGLAGLIVGTETYLTWRLTNLSMARFLSGFPATGDQSLAWYPYVVMIAPIITLAALFPLSQRIEHENKIQIPVGALVSVFIFLSLPILYFTLQTFTHKYETQLMPFWYPWHLQEMKDPVIGPFNAHGFLVKTVSGDLLRITGKKRELLYKSTVSPSSSGNEDYIFEDSYFSSDGSLWTLIQPDKHNEDLFQIWKAEPEGHLRLFTSFRSEVHVELLAEENGVLRLYGRQPGSIDYVSANIPKPGEPLVSIPSAPGKNLGVLAATYPSRLEALKDTDQVAHLDTATGVLTQVQKDGTKKTWELSAFGTVIPWEESLFGSSGPIHVSYIPPLFTNLEGRAFALVLEQKNKRRNVAVCMPDGSIEFPWKSSGVSDQDFWRRRIPGGGIVWRQKFPSTILFVTSSDGKFYPPLDIRNIRSAIHQQPLEPGIWIDYRRLVDDHLWAIVRDQFVRIDLRNGQVVKDLGSVASSNGKFYWNVYSPPTAEGVYFIQNERIYLIDWNGKKEDLGPAYL